MSKANTDTPKARLNDELGKIFRERRKELGIAQWQLAEKIGTRQQVIAHIENGVAKRSVFAPEICKILGLNLDMTLFGTSEPDSYLREQDYQQLEEVFSSTLKILADFNGLHDKPFVAEEDIPSTVEVLLKKLRKHVEGN